MEAILRQVGLNTTQAITLIDHLKILNGTILYDSEKEEKTNERIHACIDGKENTITIAVKRGDDGTFHICGGVAFSAWTSADETNRSRYISDDRAEIFTLSPDFKAYHIAAGQEKSALLGSSSCGPWFGVYQFFPFLIFSTHKQVLLFFSGDFSVREDPERSDKLSMTVTTHKQTYRLPVNESLALSAEDETSSLPSQKWFFGTIDRLVIVQFETKSKDEKASA